MLSNLNLRSSTVAIEGGLCASSHVATPTIMVPGGNCLLGASVIRLTSLPLCTVYVLKEILTRWRN